MVTYILIALLIGCISVFNMVVNGRLAMLCGTLNSVVINYILGALSSVVLCAIFLKTAPSYSEISNIPLLYFAGGVIGVLVTFLFNIIVPHVPASYIVILRIIGQMLTSAIIDYLFLDKFSFGKIIGVVLFLIGLLYNAYIDKKYE